MRGSQEVKYTLILADSYEKNMMHSSSSLTMHGFLSVVTYPSALHFLAHNKRTFISFSTSLSLNCATSQPIKANSVWDILESQCGFSGTQLSSLMKKAPHVFESDSAQEALELLQSCGYSETQLRKLILDNPTLLTDQQLELMLEAISSLGLRGKDLGNVLNKAKILSKSKQEVRLIVHSLQALFGGSEEGKCVLLSALRRSPKILASEPERALKIVNLLKNSGITEEYILDLVSSAPDILRWSSDSLKLHIEYVKKLGISASSKTFVRTLQYFRTYRLEVLDTKARTLEILRFEEGEIRQMLRRCPILLLCSSEKLQKNMSYLVNSTEISNELLVKYPQILMFSLEKRIKPRHDVFKFLSANDKAACRRNLADFIALGEQRFLNAYVKDKPYGQQILQIYKHGLVS